MNMFDCDARQISLLAVLIADQIATEYNSKQQEKISAILVSVAAILDIYIATEEENTSQVNI